MSQRIAPENIRTGHIIVSVWVQRGFALEVAYTRREWFTPPAGGPRRLTVWFAGWQVLEHDPTHGHGPDTYREWKDRTFGMVIGGHDAYLIGDRRETGAAFQEVL